MINHDLFNKKCIEFLFSVTKVVITLHQNKIGLLYVSYHFENMHPISG